MSVLTFLMSLWRLLSSSFVGSSSTSSCWKSFRELLQEAVATVNAVGVPRLAGLHRAEEHLVEAERVGAILAYDVVGIDHVEHRLRHFLNGPATDILAVLEDKLGVLQFGTPGAEGVEVEDVGVDDVHVDVDRCGVVLVLQSLGDEDGCSAASAALTR